jgi:hypothetical protein
MGGLGELIACVGVKGRFVGSRASVRDVSFPLAWGMV